MTFEDHVELHHRRIGFWEDGRARRLEREFFDVLGFGGWTPDGQLLVIARVGLSEWAILAVEPQSGETKDVFRGDILYGLPFCSLSPNGRWLAFMSDPKEVTEEAATIWIVPFPDVGSRDPQKVVDGEYPWWMPDGSELLYVHEGALKSVAINPQTASVIGDPRILVEGPYFNTPLYGRPFDYDARSDRFLVVKESESPTSLVLVQGLDQELRARSDS